MTEADDKSLLEAAKRLRGERERALDELTVARLRSLRLNAVAASPDRRRFWRFVGGITAAGVALALAGVLWFRTPTEPVAPPVSDATLADLDLLSTESPEFYSDLEFYRWLATQSDSS